MTTERKNLLESLKPEMLAAIEYHYKDYPVLLDSLKEELRNEKFYVNLRYMVYIDLQNTIYQYLKRHGRPEDYLNYEHMHQFFND